MCIASYVEFFRGGALHTCVRGLTFLFVESGVCKLGLGYSSLAMVSSSSRTTAVYLAYVREDGGGGVYEYRWVAVKWRYPLHCSITTTPRDFVYGFVFWLHVLLLHC